MDITEAQFSAIYDEAQQRVRVTGSLNGCAVTVDGTRVAEFATHGTLVDGPAEALDLARRIRTRLVTDLRNAAEAVPAAAARG